MSYVEPNPLVIEEGARAMIDELGRWCLADLLMIEAQNREEILEAEFRASCRLADVLDPRD